MLSLKQAEYLNFLYPTELTRFLDNCCSQNLRFSQKPMTALNTFKALAVKAVTV